MSLCELPAHAVDPQGRPFKFSIIGDGQDGISSDGVKYTFWQMDRDSLRYMDGSKLKWADFLDVCDEHKRCMPFEDLIDAEYILSVAENGNGLLVMAFEYKRNRRDGQDVINMMGMSPITASVTVKRTDQIMLIGSNSTVIRLDVNTLRVSQRNMHGQPLMTLKTGETVVSVAVIEGDDDDYLG